MATAPALGEVAPGQLLVDPQTLTIWVGVDPSVNPAGALLVCDMQQLAAADTTVLNNSKAYTDGRLAGTIPTGGKAYSQEGHLHESKDITDFNAAVAATISKSVLPVGAIIIWSGRSDDVGKDKTGEGGYDLTDWTVCNGISKYGQTVPDLVNRFVIGSDDAPGNNAWVERGFGSTENAQKNPPIYRTMPTDSQGAHSHGEPGTYINYTYETPLSIAMLPSHSHTFTGTLSNNIVGRVSKGTYGLNSITDGPFGQVAMEPTGSGVGHRHYMNPAAAHLHNFGAQPLNVPHWALCYIMKVK